MSVVFGTSHADAPLASLEVSRVHADALVLRQLVDVLCRAFDHDAHINWLIRQDDGRKLALVELFDVLLSEMGGELGGEKGGELHATADHQAAALWFPPGKTNGWRAQALFFRRLLKIAGPLRAVLRGIDLKRMDQRHPAEPHFYLQLLGVAPEARCRGHASALLRRLQSLAGQAKRPIYLETSSQDNVAFYVRRGFNAIAETTLSDNLQLWSLLWQPTDLC